MANTVLVESSHDNREEMPDCINELKQGQFALAYRLSDLDAVSCANAIKAGKSPTVEPSCKSLENDLERAFESGMFTDFSFPYDGLPAMEKLHVAKKLKWDMRGVPVGKLNDLAIDRFRMITLTNADPNTP